jgi:hypothetical protein
MTWCVRIRITASTHASPIRMHTPAPPAHHPPRVIPTFAAALVGRE